MNDCPAELWDALDVERLKKEYHAHKVILNGPHYWMMDSNSIEVGETATFGGLEARFAAKMGLRTAVTAIRGKAYEPFSPNKTQKMVYAAGKLVYELVDPEGHAYVLQAHDEAHPIESLAELGEQMKELPAGWQYRSRELTDDLVIDLGPDRTIYTVGDEFHQYYTRTPETT
jgi:hypothetical protein